MRAVEHPSVIVDDAKEALAEKKHALDETAATIAAEFASPADKKRLPVVLRVFGVLLIIGSGVALPVIAKTMYQAVTMFDSGAMRGEGISTIVVTFVNLAVLVALAVTLIVFGVRLIRNQRRWAALLSYGLYVLLLAGALCSIMLAGIGYELIPYGVGFAVTVARGRGACGGGGRHARPRPLGQGLHHAELLQPVLDIRRGQRAGAAHGRDRPLSVRGARPMARPRGAAVRPVLAHLRLRRGAHDHLPQPLPQKQLARHLSGGGGHRRCLRGVREPVHAVRVRRGGLGLL